MMRRCDEIAEGFSAWERNGLLPFPFEELEAHCSSCPACAERYRNVIPLAARDHGVFAGGLAPPSPPQAELRAAADSVMERIAAEPPAGRRRARMRAAGGHLVISRHAGGRPPAWGWLAAAAVLAIAVGLLTWGPIARTAGTDKVEVHIVVTIPDARSVTITGDFMSWNPEGYAMKRTDQAGTWEIRLKLERGVYLYNFIVDGETWVTDPASPVEVDDGFGGKNSLMRI